MVNNITNNQFGQSSVLVFIGNRNEHYAVKVGRAVVEHGGFKKKKKFRNKHIHMEGGKRF